MGKNRFDPRRKREWLSGELGIRFRLSSSLDEARAGKWVGNAAWLSMKDAIYALLVGFHDEGVQVLQKAHDWLEVAIREHEMHPVHYVPHGTEMQHYFHLALSNWLLHACHDLQSLHRSINEAEVYDGTDTSLDIDDVDFFVPICYDAGEYAKGVAMYERVPGLKSPKNINWIISPGVLAYVLCQHHIAPQFSDEQVERAVQNFLKRHVPGWLGDGLSVQAAHWMKMIFWRGGEAGRTPIQSLLKCYDYLEDAAPLEPPMR